MRELLIIISKLDYLEDLKMFQGILIFQFIIRTNDKNEIEPIFQPIEGAFSKKDRSKDNYSDLLDINDLFAIYYNHTTGKFGKETAQNATFGNSYIGQLNKTPFQVVSFYRRESDGSQYLIVSFFEIDDEIEIFDKILKNNAERLSIVFKTLTKSKLQGKISTSLEIIQQISEELKFTVFQIERLTNLSKLQKAALIFNSDKRLKVLDLLRDGPISKTDLLNELEKIEKNPNLELILDPFLDLNLIKRDWIKGEREKKSLTVKNQGEFFFLVKDVILARVPNKEIFEKVKESKKDLIKTYEEELKKIFSVYDPCAMDVNESKQLAALLLNPDTYDFIQLLKNSFYPLDKIPKILSEWADKQFIMGELKNHKIITEIEDESNKKWILLLTDIKPLVIFPEFLLSNIRNALKVKSKSMMINTQIAQKALDLLEVSYSEKSEF